MSNENRAVTSHYPPLESFRDLGSWHPKAWGGVNTKSSYHHHQPPPEMSEPWLRPAVLSWARKHPLCLRWEVDGEMITIRTALELWACWVSCSVRWMVMV